MHRCIDNQLLDLIDSGHHFCMGPMNMVPLENVKKKSWIGQKSSWSKIMALGNEMLELEFASIYLLFVDF